MFKSGTVASHSEGCGFDSWAPPASFFEQIGLIVNRQHVLITSYLAQMCIKTVSSLCNVHIPRASASISSFIFAVP